MMLVIANKDMKRKKEETGSLRMHHAPLNHHLAGLGLRLDRLGVVAFALDNIEGLRGRDEGQCALQHDDVVCRRRAVLG